MRERTEQHRERFVTRLVPAVARAARIAAVVERRRLCAVVEDALIAHLERGAPGALELAGLEDAE